PEGVDLGRSAARAGARYLRVDDLRAGRDGAFVVGGETTSDGTGTHWFVARVSTTGTIVATRVGVTSCGETYTGLDVAADGSVYLSGQLTTLGSYGEVGVLARLRPDLTLDDTFGHAGIQPVGVD